MKKRILLMLLAVAILTSCVPCISFSVSAADGIETNDKQSQIAVPDDDWYSNETGDDTPTELNIYNEDDFLAFGKMLSECLVKDTHGVAYAGYVIHLRNDIDLSKWEYTDITGDWYNYVRADKTYGYIFDGHGYTVKSVPFTQAAAGNTTDCCGVFAGKLKATGSFNEHYQANAGIFNLKIVDTTATFTRRYCGGLVGRIEQVADTVVRFENVYVDVDVVSNGNYCGGFVGADLSVDSVYRNCIYAGNMNASGSTVGGIIGHAQYNSIAQNNIMLDGCMVSGVITASQSSNSATNVGGFIGNVGASSKSSNITVTDCAFKGSILQTATASFSGLSTLVANVASGSSLDVDGFLSAGVIEASAATLECAGVIAGCGKGSTLNADNVIYVPNSQSISAMCGTVHNGTVGQGCVSAEVETLVCGKADLKNGFIDMPTGKIVPVGVACMVREGSEETQYLGYQMGERSVRFVAGGDSDRYSMVGFDISIYSDGQLISGGNSTETAVVYSSVMGNVNGVKKVYTSVQLGVNYLYTVKCDNIPEDRVITFTVKTYHIENGMSVYDDIYVVTVGGR